MKNFEHVFQPGFYDVFQKDYYLKGNWAQGYFKNNNPVILELGCGKGEYTTGLAEINPDKNYIGVDIKGARIWRGAKTAKDKNLKNVAFIRTSIELINSFFGINEVSEIWLTFSDPQPKKPKKRLSSSSFLNRYIAFLQPNATIHIKTDNVLLFEYSLAVARINQLAIKTYTNNVYLSENLPNPVKEIQTFYEKQFLLAGKCIYYLEYIIPGNKAIVEPEEFNRIESAKYKE